MLEIGIAAIGFAVGMLSGITMVWDRRFNDGRRYGYKQGCERRYDQDALARIRELM